MYSFSPGGSNNWCSFRTTSSGSEILLYGTRRLAPGALRSSLAATVTPGGSLSFFPSPICFNFKRRILSPSRFRFMRTSCTASASASSGVRSSMGVFLILSIIAFCSRLRSRERKFLRALRSATMASSWSSSVVLAEYGFVLIMSIFSRTRASLSLERSFFRSFASASRMLLLFTCGPENPEKTSGCSINPSCAKTAACTDSFITP
mmetsp:Transcript_30459/g.69507  ORF Transcript_30459/g.69507 Transcript_30459/m.69507 type:complete len:206 (+) Transcript_30459:1-618(+)